mmetsp:Transcript_25032/g.42533  ORF Transcript_25032/g.42533 Transcript_25032/m.42533 type:complete len:188 (-) Transcript_25032:6-569(-)
MSVFITLLESSLCTSADVWHTVNSVAFGQMTLRCCFVSEVIGTNKTFPPACFSFAEDVVGVDLVGGVLAADCGDVSLSPPPPLANEKPDFEADACGDVSLSPPPPLAKEKLDFDGGVFADACGDVSLSPPPPLAKEKPDFDGEVYDTVGEAFDVGEATSAFLLPMIVALLSLLFPIKKCWYKETGAI